MPDTNTTPENPSLLARAAAEIRHTMGKEWENIKTGWDNLPVIGQGHFMAWIRQGFKELTHMLLPAFPQGQHIVEEPGLMGNPTQGEVARNRQDDGSVKHQVSTLNEEPMQTQTAVRSPADLLERNGVGQQQQGRQEVSPADLVERNSLASQRHQPHQEASPGDLAEGKGLPEQQQQNQGQQQQQGHGLSM